MGIEARQRVRNPFDPAFYDEWLARGGEAPPPRHVSLDLTYRCNLRCNMCFLYGDHLAPDYPALREWRARRELDASEWRGVLSQLWDLGVRNLVLTGGEIFLRKDVLDLIEFAVEKGFALSLLSNGSLITDRVADALVRIGPSFLRFSLEGSPPVHDRICGRPSHQRLMDAIDRIRGAQRHRSAERPLLGLETVVQRLNQGDLHHVLAVAHAKGIHHLTFSNIFFAAERERCPGVQTVRDVEPSLRQVDAPRLADELERCQALAQKWGIGLVCRMRRAEEIEPLYRDPDFAFLRRCFYPWLMARINPYGDVIPCTGSGLALGNLREHGFAEIWNGSEYRRFRSQLLEAGLFPECAKCNTLSDENWKLWDRVEVPLRASESAQLR